MPIACQVKDGGEADINSVIRFYHVSVCVIQSPDCILWIIQKSSEIWKENRYSIDVMNRGNVSIKNERVQKIRCHRYHLYSGPKFLQAL